MKVETSIIAAVAAMVAIGLATPSYADDMTMNPHQMGRESMMKMDHMDKMDQMSGMCIEHASEMGLTNDQIVKLKPLHNQMMKKHAQFTADKKIAEIEMMEIMEVKDFDLEKANRAVKKISDAKAANQMQMLKDMKVIRNLLTEDQFSKMKQMMTGSNQPVKKMMKQ